MSESQWSTDRGVSERRLLEIRDHAWADTTRAVETDEGMAMAAELLTLRELHPMPIEVRAGSTFGTPGPWLAYRSNDQWHIRSIPAEVGVASVIVSEPGKVVPADRADALLIAAAPALALALERLADLIAGSNGVHVECSSNEMAAELSAAKKAAAAALRAAGRLPALPDPDHRPTAEGGKVVEQSVSGTPHAK